MWMLQPPAETTAITIALPRLLVESLGVGAEVLASHLNMLAEVGVSDPAHHPPPMPILCRVCERQITPWWFEKHSDLCVQEHRAELDVQMAQESLAEHRHAIVKVLDALEVRKSRSTASDGTAFPTAPVEYKGLAIGPSSSPSSGSASGLASQSNTPTRSRSPSTGLGHARARSFAVRRPQLRIVELILDLCDTAMEISTPSIKETKSDEGDEFRTQSPQSESRISQVLQWQSPSSNTMEQEQGLAMLSADTERLCRAKVEAVLRHRRIIEYSERIRQEFTITVEECIAHAMRKAERLAAGETLSSSEDGSGEGEDTAEGEDDEEARDNPEDEPTPVPNPPSMSSSFALPSMASMTRNADSSGLYSSLSGDRRSSSAAISTRSSSPLECPTPRSHRSTLLNNPQPSKRASILMDPEANDSDASLQSSLSGFWRTESPSSDQGLSRSLTSGSRSRKSLVLHGLGSNSPRRQESPGHPPVPQAPPSPLRMGKSRMPSGENAPSPVTSPLLTTGEFVSPALSAHHHVHHHRRQSSAHSTDPRAPPSPRLAASHPLPRAQPPSIKDFEIIKPISKGAFGSVYLSKKKSTGDYYAIKVLKKADMISKNQVTNVKAERAIMMWQGESDFVAKLYWTFSSKDYLYLVMEYLNGGDCASLIKILGGLPEDWCKKYIAEVVLGIEHLHSRGIVHRDLKPDNLLIDQKGHLKLTDFGLSRMGLVGRQKRALRSANESVPDLLQSGPFHRSVSTTSSRSASFDFQGHPSPGSTPMMTPAFSGGLDQPSYFSLSRETSASREPTRQGSGHRSDSGGNADPLNQAFRSFSLHDTHDNVPMSGKPSLIEEESYSQGSASPDMYPLAPTNSNASQSTQQNSLPSQSMLPPPMALFDPEDTNRKFVGTPDYLAPETINGLGQDEMSDWWSVGCIMFEFLYGFPPFNASSPEEVFENILARRIAWPEEPDFQVSDEAKDLIDKMIRLDPRDRLGANIDEKFPTGAAEIKNHPWFSDVNWDNVREDEPQFVPSTENPEDTEYFDARGATLQSFPEEIEEQINSPPALTPGGSELPDRPHDALLRVRTQVNAVKRGLMPLHIPPHVARDSRSRRLSEPVVADDFGNFTFKNLPVLEKANKDIVNKMRAEAMQAQSKAVSTVSSPAAASPPSLEGSPLLPMPLKRTMSSTKGHRPASPSGLGAANSSPSRPSAPSSPLLVQFSTAQNHERRKTSSSSQSSTSLQPGSFFELPKDPNVKAPSVASSPIKHMRMPAVSPAKLPVQRHGSTSRSRSQTVGSQDGDPPRESFIPGHHKRRSQLLQDISPSSSDNEGSQNKALLNVQRRRQSSRRLSQITSLEGPMYRPLDVLICEDHPVSRMVMERLFEKLRCRTITATNGPEALRLSVSQINFDIIIMEFKLPKLNGADIARMIRDTRNANEKTPIVCLTGYLKELPDVHHFDALMEKPPTLTKLTETLCKYCAWKPPPKDFKMTQPLAIPTPTGRADRQRMEDSPSSTSSSFPTVPESYRGSSREDSIGSGFFSDLESAKNDDVPVIIARQTTDDWPGSSGLGISEEVVTDQKPYVQPGFPHLVHTESAPAAASLGTQTPRKQRSAEVIEAKRQSLDKKRREGGGAEEGDDEDEELGIGPSRTRSPPGRTSHIGSRLGYEMMRTNSQGSVISLNEEKPAGLAALDAKMQALTIPDEEEPDSAVIQPRRTMQRTPSQHSHPEPEFHPTDDAETKDRGHITPPIIFPKKPGHGDTKEIVDDGEDAKPTTPVGHSSEVDEEQTPKPHGSPASALRN